jgi:transposase
MQAFYGNQFVDVSTVRRWVRQFKDGGYGFKNKTPIFFKGRI